MYTSHMNFNKILAAVGSYIIVFAVIPEISSQNWFDGRECTLLDGSPGVCKPLVSCKWTENALASRIISYRDLPRLRCGFLVTVEYTCCKDIQTRLLTTENRKSQEACNSYRQYRQPVINKHILSGTLAALGEFPHMAALGYLPSLINETHNFLCGGSLISDRYILTAAHCYYGTGPIIARLGTLNIITPEVNPGEYGNVLDIDIESFTQHPEYTPLSKYHDIALAYLATVVRFDHNLHPACLHEVVTDNFPSTELLITGWGIIDVNSKEKSPFLLKANLTAVNLTQCNNTLIPFYSKKLPHLTYGQFCAGDPTGLADGCKGDSGGPIQILDVVTDNLTMPIIIGVTSVGYSCGTPIPSLFTRVAFYLDWIETIVWPN